MVIANVDEVPTVHQTGSKCFPFQLFEATPYGVGTAISLVSREGHPAHRAVRIAGGHKITRQQSQAWHLGFHLFVCLFWDK